MSSFFPMVAQARWKPDLVINVVPTLFCSPAALLTARLARARSALDIQDYEVDALFGLGMAQGKGRLQRLALGCERTLLRAFDRVSTISPGMLKRAADKGVDTDKLIFFPNWFELNRFRDIAPDPQYLAQLGVPPGKRVLLYSGNLGEK